MYFLFDHRSFGLNLQIAEACCFGGQLRNTGADLVTKERLFRSVVTVLSRHDQLRPADLKSPTVLELLRNKKASKLRV